MFLQGRVSFYDAESGKKVTTPATPMMIMIVQWTFRLCCETGNHYLRGAPAPQAVTFTLGEVRGQRVTTLPGLVQGYAVLSVVMATFWSWKNIWSITFLIA